MVSTLNGKITRDKNSDVGSWASKEDQDFFNNFKNRFKVSIMGANTYEAVKKDIDLNIPRKRIVMTRDTAKYAKDTVSGKIEFTSAKPSTLIRKLQEDGFTDVLLLGGGEINRIFLEEDLVTDFYLTLEPKLFGKGTPLVTDGNYFLDFKLKSARKLNPQGTYLFHFQR